MRLLIYLLAMMTGFSAAEAARPVAATPATMGSSISQRAIIVASVALAAKDKAALQFVDAIALTAVLSPVTHDAVPPVISDIASPVTRHDLTRI